MAQKHLWMVCIILVLLAIGLGSLPAGNTLAGTTFLMNKYTFGNAGGQMQSSNYTLNATFGQPSVVGQLSSSNLRLKAGYWTGSNMAVTDKYLYLPVVVR